MEIENPNRENTWLDDFDAKFYEKLAGTEENRFFGFI